MCELPEKPRGATNELPVSRKKTACSFMRSALLFLLSKNHRYLQVNHAMQYLKLVTYTGMVLLPETQGFKIYVLARCCENKSPKERSQLSLSILLPTLETFPKTDRRSRHGVRRPSKSAPTLGMISSFQKAVAYMVMFCCGSGFKMNAHTQPLRFLIFE